MPENDFVSIANLFRDKDGVYSYLVSIKGREFERLLQLARINQLSPKATIDYLINNSYEDYDLKSKINQIKRAK